MPKRNVKSIHQLIKQALQYRFLTAGQLHEMQRARDIKTVAEHAQDTGNEFLADQLFDILASLDGVIDDREDARRQCLSKNRVP